MIVSYDVNTAPAYSIHESGAAQSDSYRQVSYVDNDARGQY